MFSRLLTYGVYALAGVFLCQSAHAQNDISVEEIIVTATKRAKTLQEVPISVQVVDSSVIEMSQVVDLIDLQTVVPALRVTQLQSSSNTNFVIRGFGNGANNAGIESSVGIFIDGVYRSRSASNILDLPDLERVEVLRGPQSTLFGKNSSVGAISIITKNPEFDFGGQSEISFGNFNQIIAKGTFTGPLNDKVAFRVSGSVNKRNGYYTNALLDEDINDRDRWAMRAQLLFTPNDQLSFRLSGEWNEADEICCGAVSIFNGPATQAIGAPFPFGLGQAISPAADFDARTVNQDSLPQNELAGKGISLHVNYDFGKAELVSITAYREQTDTTDVDVDFTGAHLVTQTTDFKFQTFTQEVRLASTGDDNFVDWLVGAFYFKDEIPTCCRNISYGPLTNAYANAISGGLIGQAEAGIGLPLGSFFGPGQGVIDRHTLDDESYSLFGEFDINAADRLTLTLGFGYIDDRKQATSNVLVTDILSNLNLVTIGQQGLFQAVFAQQYAALGVDATDPAAIAFIETIAPGTLAAITAGAQAFAAANATNPAFNPLLGLQPLQVFRRLNQNYTNIPNANETGVLTGDELTYSLRAAYDVSDNVNAYVSYATGWKAGAFNISSDSTPPDENGIGRTAKPEEIEVIELGVKANFDRGYINLAVFDQKVKEFQSNLFTGTAFQLANAGSESHKGLEVDSLYRPIDPLTLTLNLIYIDANYDSFTAAPCADFDVVNCGNGELFRDLTGTEPAGIHELSLTASAMYTRSLTNSAEGFIRGEYLYESSASIVDNVPPVVAGIAGGTRKVNLVNVSAGITTDSGLQVIGWVRNLTDDDYLLSAFPTVFQAGSFSGYVNAPRTYGLTVRQVF